MLLRTRTRLLFVRWADLRTLHIIASLSGPRWLRSRRSAGLPPLRCWHRGVALHAIEDSGLPDALFDRVPGSTLGKIRGSGSEASTEGDARVQRLDGTRPSPRRNVSGLASYAEGEARQTGEVLTHSEPTCICPYGGATGSGEPQIRNWTLFDRGRSPPTGVGLP